MKYVFLLCFLSSFALADPVVIVNPQNDVAEIDSTHVNDIFLKKQTRFEGGEEAVPINASEGEDVRDEFYDKVSQKSPAQLRAYWAKSVFTGNKPPPKEMKSSDDIKAFVKENPGGIAYIDENDVDENVKVIMAVE